MIRGVILARRNLQRRAPALAFSLALACIATLLVRGPEAEAGRFLKRTEDTIIPAPPGSRGDVVPDSVINLLDLIRLRDIVHGTPPAPIPAELTQGDLNLDGAVTGEDINIVGRVLLKLQGVPQVVSAATGGSVVSDHVAMTFAPEDVVGAVAIGVAKQSEAQVQGTTGLDFQRMAADSSYYMTGYKLGYSDNPFVYPPRMAVALDSLPPCQLQGSNLLMAARRGPLNDAQSVMIAELQAHPDSTLTSAEPPHPVIGQPSKSVDGAAMQTDQYEPLQYMLLPVTNISASLTGNVVVFAPTTGDTMMMAAAWFEPMNHRGLGEVTHIAVAVPNLPPGPASVRYVNLGTELWSSPRQIQVLLAHSSAAPILPTIESTFAKIDSIVVGYPDFGFNQMFPFTLLEQAAASIPGVLRPFFQAAKDSLLQSSLAFQELNVAWLENLNVAARIDTAFALEQAQPESTLTRRTILRAMETLLDYGMACWPSLNDTVSLYHGKGSWEGSSEIALPLTDCPQRVFEGSQEGSSEIALPKVSHSPFDQYRPAMAGSAAGRTGKAFDTTYQPKKYPNYCMNIWRHNTNGAGGGSPGGPCPPGAKRRQEFLPRKQSVSEALAYNFESPLKDAIVIPTNGGIPGIVGVINGAGTFAIPGLAPGDTIHFAIYDPKTGLYDSDAGYAVTPNIAEQGAWFSLRLAFNPNATVAVLPLQLYEQVEGAIDAGQQRYEYVLTRTEQDPGAISLGFCATVPMRLAVTAPNGQVLADRMNDSGYLSTTLLWDQEGAYRIDIGYGSTPQSGSFVLGTWDHGAYPLRQIGCSPEGRLPDQLSPFSVVGTGTVPAGRSLVGGPGQVVEFGVGAVLKANGTLQASGVAGAPFVLKPAGALLVVKE